MRKNIIFVLILLLVATMLMSCGMEEQLVSEAVNNINPEMSGNEEFEYPGATTPEGSAATIMQDGIRFNRFNFVNIDGIGDVYVTRAKNSDEVFKFYDCVMIEKDIKWYLCSDIGGINVIPSKTIKLVPGDNIYYIMTEKNDGKVAIYTMNVYKSNLVTVEFENSTTITVDEYSTIDLTTNNIPDGQKDGYKFIKWDFDFTTSIKENTVIHAIWEPIE